MSRDIKCQRCPETAQTYVLLCRGTAAGIGLRDDDANAWRVYYHDAPHLWLTGDDWIEARGRHFYGIHRFADDVTEDRLATYTFIEPRHVIPPWNSQHPSALSRTSLGDKLIEKVYNALAATPAVVAKSLFVVVSDEHGAADVVIDAKTNQQLSVIPLGGEAGNTVYDSRARRILVAVHGKNELVSIDPVTAKIVARTPLPGVENPHGIAVDVEGRLAFVAGEANGVLAVVDLETLRVIETHKVAEGPDVLAFDPGWRRLYVASESGGVNVFTEASPRNSTGKRLVRDGDISMPHAHTVAVDPRSHLVYFPLENIDGQAILRIMSSNAPTALPR